MDQKRVTRKLRAILSADVQGYGCLMGDDEVATVKTITEYRQTISSIVSQYHGRVVDSPGDNVLSEFGSVVDAVQCAVEIQTVLKAKNEELSENRRMIFRIGVNLGDVIHEGDRIYGDGVNIAARIESLAEGGGICISGTAYDQIKNKLALGYNYLGEHSVKNISEPVRVYKVPMGPEDVGKKREPKQWKNAAIAVAAVLILGIVAAAVWNFYLRPTTAPVEIASKKVSTAESSGKATPLPLPEKPSIAVLPFDNMSGDPNQEYFSDGITEQIISSLAKVPQLLVIARNSSFTYRGKPVKVQQVAKELGVRYVLEGSVQKSGDRVRISAQLIDARAGDHIWSENYDRDLKDIFALQDEITMKIITAIRVKLTDGEAARVMAKGTNNRQAYDKYMKALKLLQNFTKEEIHQARKELEEVVALDPGWSMPYTFQSWTHIMDLWMRWSTSPLQSMQKAEELGQKAVSLDDENAMAHAQLCQVYLLKRKYDESISEGRRAVALAPNLAVAYTNLGMVLNFAGEPNEGLGFLETAIRLNPLPDAGAYSQLGFSYRDLGQYDKAIEACKKAIRIAPNHLFAHTNLTSTYSLAGRETEAHAQAKEILRINPDFSVGQFSKMVPFKNKADKDRVMDALRKAGLPEKPSLPVPDKPSIAVLPFSNIAGDPKEQYLCDGFTEQIITVLAKTPGLSVSASNTSFTYKGQSVNVQQVGKDLGVQYVLEGSVQKSGDRLRVTAQLIDTTTGNHLWAEKYDRNISDIFELQDEIALKILGSLQIKLVGGTGMKPCARATDNVDAYLKFLQADHYFNMGTIEGLYLARQLCQESIAADPEYGPAYALEAHTYLFEIYLCVSKSPKQSVTKAFELAKKALSVNNLCPFSRTVMGYVYMYMGQYKKGIEEMEAAIAMEPNWADAYVHSTVLSTKPKEAVELMEKAFRMNPLPPVWYYAYLGMAYRKAGMYEKAIAAYKEGLRKVPSYFGCHVGLAIVYAILGREEDVRLEVSEMLKVNPHYSLACIEPLIKSYSDEAVRRQLIEGLRKAGLR